MVVVGQKVGPLLSSDVSPVVRGYEDRLTTVLAIAVGLESFSVRLGWRLPARRLLGTHIREGRENFWTIANSIL